MLSFAEGDKVDYHSPAFLPSGPAIVVDVLVEGDLTEPRYVIALADVTGTVFADQSQLTPRAELVNALRFGYHPGYVRLPGDLL